MMRALYTAASGMMAQQLNLDNISNNLANVNTTAYKKSRIDFQDLLYTNLKDAGSDAPVGAQVGLGVRAVSTQRSFSQGSLSQTGNPLDVAIQGEGFFQVVRPDGSKAYTRDGAFNLNANGELVNKNGDKLGITFPPGCTDIKIEPDGTIKAIKEGETEASVIGKLQLVKFMNPQGLKAIGSNLFVETAASGEPRIGTPGEKGFGGLAQGYLEKSNINVVEEMINIIQAQRAYEINQKGIQAADQMERMAAQLKSK